MSVMSSTPPPASTAAISTEILAMLRSKAEAQWEYFNPNFLTEITDLIESYYGLRDDVVDGWIAEMYSA